MKPASILILTVLTVIFSQTQFTHAKKLETVSDNEFLKLVKTEKFVVALFSKTNCPKCEEFEHELSMSREILVDSIGAWVVKLTSSPLARLYSPELEPAVVFFRHGIPMLYHGPINEDDLLSKIQRSQEPAVKELSDDNFEHLTQASTGATTGDWFVMFYKQTCVTSQRLQAIWEAVGSDFKGRINVARVDKGGNGAATGRRFEVSDTPTFILFRLGKLYKYELEKVNIPNLIDFATDFFRNSKGIPVPQPKSPFDDFTEMVAEKLKENPMLLKFGSIGISIIVLVALLIKCRGGKKAQPEKSSKKKKT